MTILRSNAELERALWADKRMSVAEGTLYDNTVDTPFPIREYFKMGLLGKDLSMVEANAGHALVENITADTLTELKVSFYTDPGKKKHDEKAEEEYAQWRRDNEYDETMSTFMRTFYGAGYAVSQPMRMPDPANKLKNIMTITNVQPSAWYPDIPLFAWQPVTSGRIITIFSEVTGTRTQWYAFVEKHTIGKIEYFLYKIEHEKSLEGETATINSAMRFSGFGKNVVQTDLPYLGVSQQNRSKQAGFYFGNSVFRSVWSYLQEVSETQTQIRQERIKHFRSKMYLPREVARRATGVPGTSKRGQNTSKEGRSTRDEGGNGPTYDATQDMFILPPGADPPGYIKWDMDIIKIGADAIKDMLSNIAAFSGFPRSVFNLDEKGLVHEGTDRRNNRRYVSKIQQGQARGSAQARLDAEIWYRWTRGLKNTPEGAKGIPTIEATFASPFGLSQAEQVEIFREMNPNADFVSQKEAMRNIWPGKTDKELEQMIEELRTEQQAMLPANSSLDTPATIDPNSISL